MSSISPHPRAGAGSICPRSTQPAVRNSGWATIASPPDGAVLEVGTATLSDGVIVQVGRSSHVRDELLANFRARGLQVLALIALAAVVGGFLLTRAGLAPLRDLETTVRSILQTGQFDARVPIRHSRDPLDELGARVNEMLGRIQSLVLGMRGALDNVAHDLRTPLTRFRNVAETALVAGDADAARDGLAHALEEADRVSATLTALMDISEAETGTMALTRESVGLAGVVDEALSLYADEADDKAIAIRSNVPGDLHVIGDRTRLRQVLANLIENAVKYTGRDGRIDIGASAKDGFVTLTVRDTGMGIDPIHIPHVWDRLYRADSSRTDSRPGLGLVVGQGRRRGSRRPRRGLVGAWTREHVLGRSSDRFFREARPLSIRRRAEALASADTRTLPPPPRLRRRPPKLHAKAEACALLRDASRWDTRCHICHLPDRTLRAALPSNRL